MAELPAEIRERLGLWERPPRPLAPLSERQGDSVVELREAFLCPPAPPELPIEDLSSLGQPSLTVTLTAAVPESTEDILVKGFSTLGMEKERIETAQQLQTRMDEDEGAKYRQMRASLLGFEEQCDAILSDVNRALEHLALLQKQFLFVSTKTGTLHEACEQLLKEQSELVELAENIQQKLSYFNELENINTKLNSPTLSVNSEGFIPMLAKLDDCITYISSHPNFRDYPVYSTKFKQCLSKAMHLMKMYTVNTLQNLTNQMIKRDPSAVPNSDNAFTLFYVKFRAAAPKVRVSLQPINKKLPTNLEQKLSCLVETPNTFF
ncbi:UNVERIFIED_CONTAM: Golgi transport complex subunit 3 [Gekko kuhli]